MKMKSRIANALTAVVSLTALLAGVGLLKYAYVVEHLVIR